MTTGHTHEHAEHKAPAKKRAPRKKVDKRTHREREFDAFMRNLVDAMKQPLQNRAQIMALTKKAHKYAPPEGV